MWHVNADRLAGCDPWDRSITLCREAGLKCRLDVTDYLPTQLPYEPRSIDLAFAFSVFTHTSLRASRTALSALRKCISYNGVLAITIRPVEYWDYDERWAAQRDALKSAHRSEGFAFMPHGREAVDGDITYGDTSMTFEFLSGIAEGWQIVGYDRTLSDPYQIIVFLRPV